MAPACPPPAVLSSVAAAGPDAPTLRRLGLRAWRQGPGSDAALGRRLILAPSGCPRVKGGRECLRLRLGKCVLAQSTPGRELVLSHSWTLPHSGVHSPSPVRALFSSCPELPTKAATRIPGAECPNLLSQSPTPIEESRPYLHPPGSLGSSPLRSRPSTNPLSLEVLIPCRRLVTGMTFGRGADKRQQ